jgi:hypothetical protein
MPLDIKAPVAGLVPGPATEASVKTLLNLEAGDTRDDARIELNINAANSLVATFRKVRAAVGTVDPLADPPVNWPDFTVLGASLLAARWVKRNNSPAGVIDLGGDVGVAYVQRNDPDIGIMLGLGPYAAPAVG